MSTPVPSTPHSSGSEGQIPGETPVALGFEETLRRFWEKNARPIFVVCVVVLLAIVAKGAFDLYIRQRDKGLESEYDAATTSEKLKSFASAHPDTILAGVSYLRLADEAYTAGKYGDAAAAYQQAAGPLKTTPLEARAQLGIAISKIQAGQGSDGEAKLKDLANDAKLLKAVRAEANYDLASLAVASGKIDEATKYLDAVNTLDPSGAWSQRALALRASLPAGAGEASAASAVKLPSKP